MQERMNALIACGPGDYRLVNTPAPEPGPGEILIRVEACGICAGDLKAFEGAPRFWGTATTPAYVEPPAVPGHEFVGRVAALGSGVTGYTTGDRLIAEQIHPCGKCLYCRTQRYWLCQKHDVFGFKHYLNGGMAEYMIFPAGSLIHRVPDHLPLDAAALIEPYACSRHGVDRSRMCPGDVVVISGAGTLGLGMVSEAKRRSPKLLISLDLNPQRLALAKQFGADRVFDPAREPALEEVLELTDGYGCDVYIEATGHPASIRQGLDMLKKGGTFVEFSVFKDPATLDWSIIGDEKELTIYGSQLSPGCYPDVISCLAEGSLKYEGVVTHRYPLDAWEEAFRMAGSGEAVKVLLVP